MDVLGFLVWHKLDKSFEWDYRKAKCWSKQLKDILCSVNLEQLFVF